MGGAQGPGPTAQQKYRMQLYQDHYEQVRRYFARHVECPQDVDDLVQTVFLNLMANTGAMRNPRRYVQTGKGVSHLHISHFCSQQMLTGHLGRPIIGRF